MNILITGYSGFVGKNLISFLNKQFSINKSERDSSIVIKESVVIHLAGKAHDFRKSSNSDEYYQVNTELSQKVFDAFIDSDAKVLITLSSVKAVADEVIGDLTEDSFANPVTQYGKSKLAAEQYILSKVIPV